jgi:acetate kinase
MTDRGRVLVVNAGSSSLKLSVVQGEGEDEQSVISDTVENWGGVGHTEPIADFLDRAGAVGAVGHRVVHGGPEGDSPRRLDDGIVRRLEALTDLAPLHQPRAIAGIEEVTRLLPEIPAAAAFDTTFHRTLPPAARTYALPKEWNERWGLRRYGFHGLSHAGAARRGAQLAGADVNELRIVSCHLGSGASLCAIRGSRSVATTMGFTPAEGLVMATRPGNLDPGLLLWLLKDGRTSLEELTTTLEQKSGLEGLCDTDDMREVVARAARGDESCQLAFDVYLHTLVTQIAAVAAAAGGLDLLIFTGGVGEHSDALRAHAARSLEFLGVSIDLDLNAVTRADADISAAGARVRTVVVTAREDLEIARQVRKVLRG